MAAVWRVRFRLEFRAVDCSTSDFTRVVNVSREAFPLVNAGSSMYSAMRKVGLQVIVIGVYEASRTCRVP